MNETWWVDPTDLDEDQKAILTSHADRSLLIIGPPGSGKTNILMLRANYVRPVGARQHVLTFTRALAEHLRSGPNVGRSDQLQRDEISTFMSWARSIITHHGGNMPGEREKFEEERRLVIDELHRTIESQRLGKLYDVMFVDEVQDFWESELQAIGALSDRLNFAGDSRQRIWRQREGLRTAAQMADEVRVLTHHYRIGEKICDYADRILPPKSGEAALLDGCNYDERLRPSSVTSVACSDREEVVTRCIESITEQLRYIQDEPIGVIGPKNELLDEIMDAIRRDPFLATISVRQKSHDYHAYDENSRVRIMTVHSAKGSEFRAVHLVEAEAFKNHNRELAFTAVTRAKTEVAVYHCLPLHGHLVTGSGQLTTDLSTLF